MLYIMSGKNSGHFPVIGDITGDGNNVTTKAPSQRFQLLAVPATDINTVTRVRQPGSQGPADA